MPGIMLSSNKQTDKQTKKHRDKLQFLSLGNLTLSKMSIYGTNDKFNTPDPELSQEKRDDTLYLRSRGVD